MSLSKADLIMHPVRFRILQTIAADSLTTQEIDDRLPDVPKSSIYRHLRLLLDGEMIEVAETRLVNGIQEKVYRLVQRPYLSAEDVAGMSADDHLRTFTTYIMTLLQGFGDYLEQAGEMPDFLADRVGYTEVSFWANDAEMDQFQAALNQAILPFLQHNAGNGRRRRKVALVSHPIT
ncbi:MAG: helix-turn-helix domain-containing protein [Ardenticatenaceae bacterium]|nr:helix-turn-helix domain-containing protein [Ardenticatenaceae bacterium]MCB9444989.1 helix-turn-helix domain-containing protein [Ardenticatenaceae bacterium]